jgi:CubicO group peptidase (beta-lactamase class C family)
MLLLFLACHPGAAAVGSAESGSDSADTAGDTAGEGTTLDAQALARLRDTMTRVLADSRHASGASMAIWMNGEIVFAEGFGSADPDTDIPVTPDTLFQIGSDTKKLTAIAALQQVEAGALDLDAPISATLPGFDLERSPGWADTVTLHQLLSHQGGTFDYTPWVDDPDDDALASTGRGVFAERAWSMAPPGAMWNYSNPNFSVAAMLVEAAAGRPWADVVTDDVFGPLGMDSTFARESDIPADAAVAVGTGYLRSDETDWFDLWATEEDDPIGRSDLATTVDNAFTRPAGGSPWSTASDSCRVAGFLVDGDPAVLSDELRTAITAQQVKLYPGWDDDLGLWGYGYGMFEQWGYPMLTRDGFYGVRYWSHGGNTMAYSSLFMVLPDQRFAVCILSNGFGDDFTEVAELAMDRFAGLPEATPNPRPGSVAPELASLVGHYEDVGIGAIEITLVDDHLEIAIPYLSGLGYDVEPTLQNVYNEAFALYIDQEPFELAFIPGEEGVMYARNRLFVGTRR